MRSHHRSRRLVGAAKKTLAAASCAAALVFVPGFQGLASADPYEPAPPPYPTYPVEPPVGPSDGGIVPAQPAPAPAPEPPPVQQVPPQQAPAPQVQVPPPVVQLPVSPPAEQAPAQVQPPVEQPPAQPAPAPAPEPPPVQQPVQPPAQGGQQSETPANTGTPPSQGSQPSRQRNLPASPSVQQPAQPQLPSDSSPQQGAPAEQPGGSEGQPGEQPPAGPTPPQGTEPSPNVGSAQVPEAGQPQTGGPSPGEPVQGPQGGMPSANPGPANPSTEPSGQAQLELPPADEVPVGEPVVFEAPEAATPNEQPTEPLVQAPPVEPKVVKASDVSVSELAELARRYEDRDNGNGGHDHGDDNDHPGNGNGSGHHDDDDDHSGPGGWCKNRGPRDCSWNDWDWDSHGNPVVKNKLSVDIEILLPNNYGGFYSVVVKARSEQTVLLPGGVVKNETGFVVKVAGSNFGTGVAFGVFNGRQGGCHQGCQPTYRNLTQLDFWLQVDNGWRAGPAYVYDCGCNDRRWYNGQWYDVVWRNGTQEVLGTFVYPANNQPKQFVPKYQKPTPLSTDYESYDCGCGVNPDVTNTASNVPPPPGDRNLWPWVLAGLGVIVVGGGILLLPRRTGGANGV